MQLLHDGDESTRSGDDKGSLRNPQRRSLAQMRPKRAKARSSHGSMNMILNAFQPSNDQIVSVSWAPLV